MFSEIRKHRRDDAGIGSRGRVIVEVDRRLSHETSFPFGRIVRNAHLQYTTSALDENNRGSRYSEWDLSWSTSTNRRWNVASSRRLGFMSGFGPPPMRSQGNDIENSDFNHGPHRTTRKPTLCSIRPPELLDRLFGVEPLGTGVTPRVGPVPAGRIRACRGS